ncbi:MAG TPA: TIM barrel protein [bacterium]|nr:TIM barrel protein [bacterium]
MIPEDVIEKENAKLARHLDARFKELGRALAERGIEIEAVVEQAGKFAAAVPSWGVASGGTRFGRFPVPGQPRDIYDKIDDAAAIHQLTRANPTVSLHIPWDQVDDTAALRKYARARGLGFDAMNSNTFEDQPGQRYSYKFGSLSHTDRAVREQAIAHNLEVAAIGQKLGSRALSIWIADGSCFPGQASLSASFERYLGSLKKIYARLPNDWTMFIEYKPFEPAFYYTVLADWGAALMAAHEVGPRCKVLVDLGHHLPGTNVEMIVARLIAAGRLGGFHFNDNKYADDDLSAGSIDPYRLFRVFHELTLASRAQGRKFRPAYLIDQSHLLKDPIEELCMTTVELQLAYVQALLVDNEALESYQNSNDVMMAETELKKAFKTDVGPVAAMARKRAGGAINPIAAYRASGYREKKAKERGG